MSARPPPIAPSRLRHRQVRFTIPYTAGRAPYSQPARATRRRNNGRGGYEKLKDKHTRLLAHCNELEDRLQLYATVINTLASQNAALAGRDAGTARVVALPRPENSPDGGLYQVPAGTRHHSRRTAPGGPRQSPMARKPGQADGSPRASAHLP